MRPKILLRGCLVVALGGLAVTPARSRSAAQVPATPLQRLVQAEIERFPGNAGIHVKHLETGEEASVSADAPFNSASVIKIPVMILAYELASRGELDLDERVEIRKADVRGGSGIFRYHDLGLNPTVRDVIRQMIITSDNTATDLAIAKVGGVAAVNRWLRANGFERSTLNQTIFETFRARYEVMDPNLRSLTPEDLYAIQSSNPAWATSPGLVERVVDRLRRQPMQEEWDRRTREDPPTWLGVLTPRETIRMLEGIERGTYVSKAACEEMKAMLRQQQSGARRLPHYLNVPVGHKTGDLPPMVANDVGILYARSGPIVVSFFSNAIRGSYGEAEDRIGELARLVVVYFDGRN
ncbi:MAG: serine hydrolase [Gemmatimonadetes bacterium]|nr:serine hydrolase [Gemmatimonadota bacterium]